MGQGFPHLRVCCSPASGLELISRPPGIERRSLSFLGTPGSPWRDHVYLSDISVRESFSLAAAGGAPVPGFPGANWGGFNSPLLWGDTAIIAGTSENPNDGYLGVFAADAALTSSLLDTRTPTTTTLLPMQVIEGSAPPRVLAQVGVDVGLIAGEVFTPLLRNGEVVPGAGPIVSLYVEFSYEEPVLAAKVTIEYAPNDYAEAIVVKDAGGARVLIDRATVLPGLGLAQGLRWARLSEGSVYFVAWANPGGQVVEGLYRADLAGGSIDLIALTNDIAPDGTLFQQFAVFDPILAHAGDVGFVATTSFAPNGAFYILRDGVISRVAGQGEFIDDTLVQRVIAGPQAMFDGRIALQVDFQGEPGNPFSSVPSVYVFDTWPCRADLTGSSDPVHPAYGRRDGSVDLDDFFYYLDLFVFDEGLADMTGSSDPFDATYGAPNGVIDIDDFFYYLDRFVEGCDN